MRVLDQYVLVEQILTSKKGAIILDTARSDEDKFDSTLKILQLGEKCERNIKVGDSPIFSKHVQFQAVRVIEKTAKKRVIELIVHEGDIIGIDDKEEEKEIEVTDELKIVQ